MARLLTLSLLGTAAAATVQQAGDAVALLQAQVDTHGHGADSLELDVSQIPGMDDIFKKLMPGGAAAGAPAAPAAPGAPPMPSMEDMMQMANTVLKMLRNDTVVSAMYSMFGNLSEMINNNTARVQAGFEELNRTVSSAEESQVIPLAADALKIELSCLKTNAKLGFEAMARFVRTIDLGSKSRQIRLGIAMAEPMMLESLNTMLEPVLVGIEALGNSSKVGFCQGLEPLIVNASAALGPLRQESDVIKEIYKQVPKIKQSPLMFMAPDVVPKLAKIMKRGLELDQDLIRHIDTIATHMNTTLGTTVFDKLGCSALQSGVNRGASLFPLLFVAVAMLLSS